MFTRKSNEKNQFNMNFSLTGTRRNHSSQAVKKNEEKYV